MQNELLDNLSDPDGLDSEIYTHGPFGQLLKNDPAYLTARAMGVYPGILTNATKRMGENWVRRQVKFVMSRRRDLKNPGRYLGVILSKNKF